MNSEYTLKKEKKINEMLKVVLLISSILSSLIQLLWFNIIINIFGSTLNLVDEKGFTKTGTTITILLYTLTSIVLIINCILLYIRENKQSKQKTFNSILYRVFRLFLDKKEKDCDKNKKGIDEKDISGFEMSETDMLDIFNEWQTTISEFSNMDRRNISIRIFYSRKYNTDKSVNFDWQYFDDWKDCSFNAEKQLDITELINNKYSSAYNLLRKVSPFLYYNDKSDAIEKHEYYENERDLDDKNVGKPYGSIFGFKFIIKDINNKNHMGIIVFFSTFEEKLSKSNKRNGTKSVEQCLLNIFKPQFELELKERIIQLLNKN